MQLLVLTPEFDQTGGGIATFYRHLLPALAQAGVTIRVIEGSAFLDRAARDLRQQDGISVETLEHARLRHWWDAFSAYAPLPGLRRHLAAAWAMWEQAEFGAGADIVEASDWGLLFVPPALDAKVPLVVQGHGSIGQISVHDPLAGEEAQSAFIRLIERAVLPLVQDVQTSSDANAGFWSAEAGCAMRMIRPAWSPSDDIAASRLSGRGFVAGRLQRWKGPDVLCEALRLLGDDAPVVEWAGRTTPWATTDEPAESYLHRQYPEIFGRKLVHRPPITPADVAMRHAAALFNIVPSTWDVFNFSAVEAMWSGRPTIVSTGAGASELIKDGVNGFLFQKCYAGGLADAIARAARLSDTQAEDIGRAARETIRSELNPKNIVSQRLAAYREAIEAFASRRPAPVNGWLRDACQPSATVADQSAFLDFQPLRMLTRHVASRVFKRVTGQ